MTSSITYASPFVPPEWIAAHGLVPRWGRLRAKDAFGVNRGVCGFAGAMIDRVLSDGDTRAVVMTTACDQMRYAAALLQQQSNVPVFLMNIPSTWQSETSVRIYREELERLGRFLVRGGGRQPTAEQLVATLSGYDHRRSDLRGKGNSLTARRRAESLLAIRTGKHPSIDEPREPPPRRQDRIPLALVGGPLLEEDFFLFDAVEEASGRIVLDATETGSRTLPDRFRSEALAADPVGELTRAYFSSIADVGQRPNSRFHEWLDREIVSHSVRGILFRRHVWCDLWHAELHRLKERSPVPVVDLDINHDEEGSLARTIGRVEAFLEMLQAKPAEARRPS